MLWAIANTCRLKLTAERDFEEYFRAMQQEYMRHYPKKGDSWKKLTFTRPTYVTMGPMYETVSTLEHLEQLYTAIYLRWRKTGDSSELLDAALVGGMIWMHRTGKVKPRV